MIRPCSEVSGKVIVTIYVGHSLDPKRLFSDLKKTSTFKRVIFFEKYNLIWITSDVMKVIVRENGQVIVSGAKSKDEALKIVKQLRL